MGMHEALTLLVWRGQPLVLRLGHAFSVHGQLRTYAARTDVHVAPFIPFWRLQNYNMNVIVTVIISADSNQRVILSQTTESLM